MGKLDGAVAIVSGGARGMGASHVRGLVAEGARVVIGDVLDQDGQALAAELGDAAAFVHLDVTSERSWKDAVAAAEKTFGPVSVLINNAGIIKYGPISDTTLDNWQRILDVNLTGEFLGMREVLPSMKKLTGDRVIINVSSTAGLLGMDNIPAYVASKWGVRGLTKAAALEFAQYGIRVVSVHPGPIATPMTVDLDDLSGAQPIARMGQPSEVTAMMVFLATGATYSTGSEWLVDGGSVLGQPTGLPAN
ncbi:MAG: SDR family oxidoreductase [Propionibacteriaceae bacterium]|nr:SDR family oxidoreductase [Propionibacteriaceae bacterium]